MTKLLGILFSPLAVVPNKTVEFLGSCIGNILFVFLRKRRKTAILNARFITIKNGNQRYAKQIARKSFSTFTTTILFSIKFYYKSEKWIQNYIGKHIHIEDRAYNLNNEDGGIALFSHFGRWEVIPLIAKSLKVKGAAVFRPLDNPKINEFIMAIRKKGRMALIPKQGAVSKSLGLLKSGYFIGIDCDQNVAEKEGIEEDFLGVKAYTSKMPAIISIRSKKKIYPLFLITTSNGNYRFIVEKAIYAPETANFKEGIRIINKQINQLIGKYVAQYPDQWLLMHRRWKNRENELKDIVDKDLWK